MLQRYFWKLLPKSQRAFLLSRMPAEERPLVNKAMSAKAHFPDYFRQQRCLFIHVPKCAGSSLCAALFGKGRPGHLPLYWYEQQFPRDYAESFKFSFVRDPLERAYSAYAYLRGNQLAKRDQAAHELVSRYRDFDDFIQQWLHPENLHKQLHFVPQTDFLCDSLGHLAMDFIGRQESLDADFRALCERLNLDVQLPHLNASRERSEQPARDLCSTRTRRLVRRAYQRDYQLLGYE
ncbi:Sulfotransferase family [Pseudomonas knackmussii B13]|uniref:Sulfotransferase family n=1 Tax=Pseudomonas knackmussii (strain DSM 6978 / CCUG 54928 / LMG 23759 / B13) TaxID=1301098 RepID=A0A024HQE2_PSEKB|nr:sulfotransferase family 2 domain-containing protein [Pseudomonas knackmussii]CDF87091.1 Sulfotransferase family [Pseudomonas knackmussii B13]